MLEEWLWAMAIVTGIIEMDIFRFLTLAGVFILAVVAFVYRRMLLKK